MKRSVVKELRECNRVFFFLIKAFRQNKASKKITFDKNVSMTWRKKEKALLLRPRISLDDLLVNICLCISAAKVNSDRNYIYMIKTCVRLTCRFKKSRRTFSFKAAFKVVVAENYVTFK